MKKVILNKLDSLWVFMISFFYLEIVFKALIKVDIVSINLLYTIIFCIFLSVVLKLLSAIINSESFNKVIFLIMMFLICLIYAVQLGVYKMFGFYYDLTLLSATGQVMDFAAEGVSTILENIWGFVLLLLPFFVCLIWHKYIATTRVKIKNYVVYAGLALVVYGSFLGIMDLSEKTNSDAYDLYYNEHNIDLSVKKLGIAITMVKDVERFIFGFEEEIKIVQMGEIIRDPVGEEEIIYDYNNLPIDFDSLINSSNGTVKMMHEYFKSETGTLQNEYTGYFKDKNLILFMAETFNEIAVDEELTPTLYKLVNSGFVFNDFYTPTISSTIGGEFQELTGLVAASGFVSDWKKGTNSFPFGIATMFGNNGFRTYAYHNHNYTFQNRHKYLQALGFTNYTGCRNGLEKLMNCKQWPESDMEMIDVTFNDYINDEQFFVYYVTVSGHGDYSWGNAMSKKYQDLVDGLEYSEKTKAYLAAQIELDRALELLINKLRDAGKLEDTVIALVGDHYPYYLSLSEMNEVADYEKDDVVEINHSNFILWNSDMDTVQIDKVGSQIDVLPTLYNLFGIPYDSRLIIGKDILSTEPGLAIFGNRSWVSDYGTYFSGSGKFVPKSGKEIPEGYVDAMNTVVSNKMNMSKLIMTQNYYKYIESEG